jgi:hypothetical protein
MNALHTRNSIVGRGVVGRLVHASTQVSLRFRSVKHGVQMGPLQNTYMPILSLNKVF